MPDFAVRLDGRGAVEIVAYGVADAEAQAEKELARAWPDAALEVRDVARAEDAPRVAESFRVGYRIRASFNTPADTAADAARAALRLARQRLDGTRFQRTAWDPPRVAGSG